MSTVETDIKDIEPTAEQLTAAKAELKQKLKNREETIGEKIYDRSVYTGIGWGANEIGSMAFTGMFERGTNNILGRARFEQWAEKLSGKFKGGKAQAKDSLMWASLNLVGCLVVPAIKIIDSHKAYLVKKLNDRFGSSGMTDEQIAARDKDVEAAIACEPTQTWKTLIIGRIAGMIGSIGSGAFILGRKGKSGLSGNDHLKHHFDKTLSTVGSKVGIKAASATPNNFTTHPQPQAHEMNAFHYYSGLAGPETVGCAITSVVLEGVSKYAAKHDPHVRDEKIYAEELRNLAKKKAAPLPADSHAQQVVSEETIGPRAL
jgi:hypothetical protein